MILFRLVRVAVLPGGAFGVLLQHEEPFAVTVERTYEVDGLQTTKIPSGIYRCTQTDFIRGGYKTYEIHVPGHSRILFHRGNTEKDADGCVIVAESFGQLRGGPAVLDSAHGFEEFWQRAGGRAEFQLEVV